MEALLLAVKYDFNPRSPHGERRARSSLGDTGGSDFNPRSPHGERRATRAEAKRALRISIHAPRTGSDIFAIRKSTQKLFQSTLPARGATALSETGRYQAGISIHAPRTGSDCGFRSDFFQGRNFNPRSPHGERPAHQLLRYLFL